MKICRLLGVAVAMLFTSVGAFSAPTSTVGYNDQAQPPSAAAATADCAPLLAPTHKPVYTSFAKHSPVIRQVYGTCYFDSVVGVVQDHILALQRKQDDSGSLRELYLARAVPATMLLTERTKAFLNNKLGEVNEESALKLVNSGSALEVIEVLENIDLPLFRAGKRHPYDGVVKTMTEAQKLAALALQKNFSNSNVLSALHFYLEKVLVQEFDNPANSQTVFHLDRIEYLSSQKVSSKEMAGRDVSPFIKNFVDQDQYALVTIDTSLEMTGEARHVARLIGYREDSQGNMTEVILQDTHGLSHNKVNGEWSIPMGNFQRSYRGILPLKVHGRFIQKNEAKIPFHAIK